MQFYQTFKLALTMLQTNWKRNSKNQSTTSEIRNKGDWNFFRRIFILLNFASLSKAEYYMEIEQVQQIF